MGYMQSQMRSQEEVVAYRGLVRIGINRPPWRFILSGKGIALAPKMVQVAVERQHLSSIMASTDDIRALLAPGTPVSLQLEHDELELSLTMVSARLARLDVFEQRVELCFVFEQVDGEMFSLCSEIQRLNQGGYIR